MKLSDLAFTSHVYNYFTNYNNDYKELQSKTASTIDLDKDEHRIALINWLNQWGCRQFAINYHGMASMEILSWYEEYKEQLMVKDKMLWELTEDDFKIVSNIYDSLAEKTASQRARYNNDINVTVGPTGASKTLFALQPNSMIPWDEPIRKTLKHNGDGESYVEYLKGAITETQSLFLSCKRNNIEPLDISKNLRRPEASVAQLIGEYFWVTITRGCYPPSEETFRCWYEWSKG